MLNLLTTGFSNGTYGYITQLFVGMVRYGHIPWLWVISFAENSHIY